MIYRLLEEEQEKVNNLHEKFINADEDKDLRNRIDNEFIDLMKNIENKRFHAIMDNLEKIADSVKEIVSDAILYEYIFVALPWLLDKNMPIPKEWRTDTKPIFKIEESHIEEYKHIDIWFYYHNMFIKFKAEESAKEPLLLFDKKSVREYLEKNVFSKYFDALEGSQYKGELINFINVCLDQSQYIGHEPKSKYRTVAKAREMGAITESSKNLIIPTIPRYQYSMSLYQERDAYLQPLNDDSMEKLTLSNGRLFFKGEGAREVSEAELRDLRTNRGIENIDLVTLRYYYSIIFNQFQNSKFQTLQDVITVGVPLLAGRKNPKERDAKAVIDKLKSYHNIMGVIKNTRNGKIRESYYQVLNFEYYDENHNIVAFSSPYMNYVIKSIYNLSIKAVPARSVPSINRITIRPTHSYLIDESIIKERNKAAVENVINIVCLIEQSGRNTPHIKASSLIERNVQLAKRLEHSKNPRAILKTTFTKTWELLESKTRLDQVYKDILLPRKNEKGQYPPEFMPTVSNLDIMFEFPHKGRLKKD